MGDSKLADLDSVIAACLGLHLEVVTEKPMAQPGETLALQIEAINRSPVAVQLKSFRVLPAGAPVAGRETVRP